MDDYVKKPEFDSLKKQVERLEGEMVDSKKLLNTIDKKIDVINEKITNTDEIDNLKLKGLEKRVNEIEEGQKWLRRTIAVELIGIAIAVVAYVVKVM